MTLARRSAYGALVPRLSSQSLRRYARASAAATLLGLAVLPAAASAATFCVGGPIDGFSCDGSSHATIQAAITAADAAPGADVVRIPAGFFDETVSALSPLAAANQTTIVGDGQGSTILTGAPLGDPAPAPDVAPPTISLGAGRHLTSLTIDEPNGNRRALQLSGATASDLAISHTGAGSAMTAEVSGPQSGELPLLFGMQIFRDGPTGRGLVLGGGSAVGLLIESASGQTPVHLTGGARLVNTGVTATNAAPQLIRSSGPGNLIHGAVLIAPRAETQAIDAFKYDGEASDLTVRDSSIVALGADSSVPAISAQANFPGATAVVVRGVAVRGFPSLACASTQNSADASASVTASYVVAGAPLRDGDACQLSGPGTAAVTAGAGFVAADPGFIDPAVGNVRLADGSPAIDAGDPEPLPAGVPVTDLYGAPRTADGNGDGAARRDAGASEWQPPAPPAPPAPAAVAPGTFPPADVDPKLPPKPKAFVSVKRSGNVAQVRGRGARALAVAAKAPKLRRGQALITVRLGAPAKLRATLHRRIVKRVRGKRKVGFRAVKGAVAIPQATSTVYLKPTGRWGGRPLAVGTYRLSLTAPNGDVLRIAFKVVRRR